MNRRGKQTTLDAPDRLLDVDVGALLVDPQRAAIIPAEHVPALLCRLGAVQSVLVARLSTIQLADRPHQSSQTGDRLLKADEVAVRTGLSRDYIYRHAAAFPFTRRVGRRTLRFSEKGLNSWLAARRRA